MPELRIALTIPGAVSLGAYEGGALAALLVAVQDVNSRDREALRVDAIAGASAGSITGVVAARTLLGGLDPVDVMWRLWVESPSLDKMWTRGRQAPLSVEAIASAARCLLYEEGDDEVAQRSSLTIHMALGALRGFRADIGSVHGPPLPGTTYLDWGQKTLKYGDPPASYEWPLGASAVAFAAASGATAAAFPPVGLDRSADADEYRDNGVTNFPPSGWLWCTDGGTLDNEPLGRALDVTNDLDAGAKGFRRVHLLVSPSPEMPAEGDDDWSDPDAMPPWTRTATRALTLLKAQNLYEDLKRVEKTNSRVRWTRELEATLASLLADDDLDPSEALDRTIDSIEAQKAGLGTPAGELPQGDEEPATAVGRKLRQALELATGLADKQEVVVDIVSPLLLPEVRARRKTVAQVVAGDVAGHFGGFLDHAYRSNDFAAGYFSMVEWLQDDDRGLGSLGLPAALAGEAVRSAARRYNHDWETGTGEQTFKGLPLRQRLQLVRVACRTGLIVARDLLRQREH